LTNRYQFQIELEDCVKLASDQEKVVLFLIDMDRFKEVNDTLGHATGDELIVEIGRRLSYEFGDSASVARLGGDEFCLLFRNILDPDTADKIAQDIVETLIARYHLSEIELTLGTSVGYALCPDDAQTGKDVLTFADTAMYHAKRNRQNVARYRPEMTDQLSANRLMNDHLAVALERNEFYLEFQPQFDSRSGEIIGAEALLRWRHEGKSVSPGRFIPMLENTGRIVEVSKWLLREVCRQQAQWKSEGHDTVVSVNVSPMQFMDDDFVDSVVRPLTEFGVSPNRLDLEITEGILIDNIDQVIEKLKQLSRLGCNISIDDFGTGYSSLAYLRQFPLDKLKIDRAFVKDIPHQDDGVIASSIIMLAELLGLEVIAEGVETVEQFQFLKDNGCYQFQGFYYSAPVKGKELTSMVMSQSVATAKV
jgi:diguanylate cyclase (GGDEF)-like protein